MRPTIICEIGSSPAPNWDFRLWCSAAAATGAVATKVQLWKPEHFGPIEANTKRLCEFPREKLIEFVNAAHCFNLTAGASVFDREAVDLAAQHCDWLKLAAREQGNIELCKLAIDTGARVYRSVSETGWIAPRSMGGHVTHLWAIQRYPAGMVESLFALLRWTRTMRLLQCDWGWSSHTTGTLDCILAAKLGAVVIEKHMDLDGCGVEAGHSLTPPAFARLARAIRR